ncbi:MAG TPA: hypothetical protein GX005_08925 [Bacteroidales bacterium]|nr:hypothetical protein [Bacteroidales bacterium]
MELKDKDNKRTITSLIVTLLFHGVILLLLYFTGLKYLDPPPPEIGVEMNIGDLLGDGNALIGDAGGSDAQGSIHDVSSSEEDFYSQDAEDSPIVAKKTDAPKKNVASPEETVNPNALFRKGKVKGQDGGGVGQGKGSGVDEGEGTGGGGTGYDLTGSGTSFSLIGRDSKSLSLPPSKTDEVGSIVVTIWVNPEGKVTRAVAGARGTTIDNRSLWRNCESAASRSIFSENPNAPFEQKGTITYKFRR